MLQNGFLVVKIDWVALNKQIERNLAFTICFIAYFYSYSDRKSIDSCRIADVYCSISGVPVHVMTLVNFVLAACDASIDETLSSFEIQNINIINFTL